VAIDREHAAAALRDIAEADRRTFQAVFYARSSTLLMLWGVITACGYCFAFMQPHRAGLGWLMLDGTGVVATAAMLGRRDRLSTQILLAFLAMIVFGVLVVTVLGPLGERRLNAFWPLLFMLGYVLAGIWVGRFFILCGASVAALTLAGFFWSGPWFALWMAAVNGGALLLGGWWLRRRGARL
jgi:hypothetical protein